MVVCGVVDGPGPRVCARCDGCAVGPKKHCTCLVPRFEL